MKLNRALLLLVSLIISMPITAADFGTNSDLPIDIAADSGESALGDGVTILKKNVHIKQGELEIQADLGKIFTKDSKVVRIELEGNPVTWHQVLPEKGTLDARALHITYKVVKSLIILTDDVFIKHPQGEVKGHEVRYDLNTERFITNSSGGDDRVHFRINPIEKDEKSTDTKPTKPAEKENESLTPKPNKTINKGDKS